VSALILMFATVLGLHHPKPSCVLIVGVGEGLSVSAPMPCRRADREAKKADREGTPAWVEHWNGYGRPPE
jgi:hypothetical protein